MPGGREAQEAQFCGGRAMGEEAKILVVDDDESALRSFELMLGGIGYCVRVAQSGEEAIERLHDRYDLVLADLRMPGLDGISLLRKVREISPDTGVIIVTGHASLDTAIEAVREGASDYLLKMATPPAIMVAVERALEKQRLRLQLQRQNRALATLHAVAAAVSATLQLADLLEHTLDETLSALEVSSGAIWLFDDQTRMLELAACKNSPEGLEESYGTIPVGVGIEGRVFQTGKLMIIDDVHNHPDISLSAPNVGSLVSVPLAVRGNVLGVMSILVPADSIMSNERVDLLRGVANQIAVGIENARLYQQVVEQAHELERANAELVATRDALVKKERLAAIGQIGLTIGHEIRNPLTAIWGRADWMLEAFPDLPAEVMSDLRVIQEMSRRINQVVKKLQAAEDRTVACIGDTRMIDIGGVKRAE